MDKMAALRKIIYSPGWIYAVLVGLSIPFLLPLAWTISTAFKPVGMIYASPPQWIPQPATLDNFRQAWELVDVPRMLANSITITALSVVGALFSSSIAGFAFATLPGRGKNFLFGLLLATMMIPASVTLLPTFILFSKLGWVNSYLPLVVPQFFANAFYVFLFRQFFLGLPSELFDSAEMDGCNPLLAYWYIALPLSKPALAAVAVFSFIAAWNDFLGPLVYLNSNSKFTISLGLSQFQGIYFNQIQYITPLSVIALLPVVIVFLLAQKYFIQGIITTRIKG